MVKVALAGGSGQIAREVVDALLATKKHEILCLTRKNPEDAEKIPGVTWAKAEYGNKTQIASLLGGVDVLLSFIDAVSDTGSLNQKSLIDGAVLAGVKRFAPSEWSSSNLEELPWYREKGTIREYLKKINKDEKVLEYTLFQPGLIIDYLVPLHTSSKHFGTVELPWDFIKRRAIVLEGVDPVVTVTKVKDIAGVVVRAVEYEGEWPVVGGINGTTLRTSKLLKVGEKARGGKPFEITSLKETDIRAGDIKSPWVPMMEFPSLPMDQVIQFSKVVLTGFLLCGLHESWKVSDEWNKLLPDYEFEDAEEFLVKHWKGQS